jgi:hypothetical protein
MARDGCLVVEAESSSIGDRGSCCSVLFSRDAITNKPKQPQRAAQVERELGVTYNTAERKTLAQTFAHLS